MQREHTSIKVSYYLIEKLPLSLPGSAKHPVSQLYSIAFGNNSDLSRMQSLLLLPANLF
jgi:hypothetical protein